MAAEATFAAQLRALRERAGLTQEELAERAGLTTHAVSALERGARTRPYPHTVRSLAAALGLDDDERAALASARRRPPQAQQPQAPARRRGAPTPSTPLIGRDDDVETVLRVLGAPDVRLVTLTGVGGVGKTRLALAVAARAATRSSGDVVWVPLAEVSDPELLLPTLGHALGVPGAEGVDATDVVTAAVGDRDLLIVLDNVEHLLAGARQVAVLLERCPSVKVLATSRAALRLRGEHEHRVLPLDLPASARPTAEEVLASAAGTLLVDRARAVSPSFVVDAQNAADVARLCERVAGIPLALELTAARLRLLDPSGLLARMEDALATGGARDLPERQRTMRATLDWSFALLAPQEQEVYRRLSVFSGGCTLPAAEAVAGPDFDVLDSLAALVEHSLVQVRDTPDGTRYTMLEPVLQHARALLGGGEDAQRAELAHANYFLEVAERAVAAYRSVSAVAEAERTTREEANYTAALEHALSAQDGDLAGRLGWALWVHWWMRGQPRGGRQAMERALALPMTEHVRIRALLVRSTMAFAQGDLDTARPGWSQALTLSDEEHDIAGQAYGHTGLGLVALASGELDDAQRCLKRASSLADRAGDEWLWTLTHIWLGTVRLLTGSPEDALRLVNTALVAARARGDRLAVYIGLFTAAQAALALGHLDSARRQLEESAALSLETGDVANLAYALEALVVVESTHGAHVRVPLMLGAAEALRETIGGNVYGYYRPDEGLRDAAARAARAALGQDAYEDALDEGRTLDMAGAAALAAGVAAPATARGHLTLSAVDG